MIKRAFTTYSLFFLFGVAGILIPVFTLNYIIDPLWYHGGNSLFKKNYAFNERISKVNYYLQDPEKYDCIIFGSSRTTLLNEKKIDGFNCFNFSFSGGMLNEFEYYAKYINKYGKKPKLAIIAIDSFSFYRDKDPTEYLPDFILQLQKPRSLIQNYLSFSVFNFSLRTLSRDSPYPRYYTEDLTGAVLQATKPYTTPDCITVDQSVKKFNIDKVSSLENLRSIWEGTVFKGFVSPISAWDISVLHYDGTLNSYLASIYEANEHLDTLFDFSIPSWVTKDPSNSYDSEHYYPETTDLIAISLINDKPLFGVDMKNYSKNEYKRIFKTELKEFIGEHTIKIRNKENCNMRTQTR